MQRPKPHIGLRHLALHCQKLTECQHFYTELLGFQIVWQPDADNIYLSSGTDNLALHSAPKGFSPSPHQHLDHLGVFVEQAKDVDEWYAFLVNNKVEIKAAPKNHRDGTRSFYCADPDGNVVQVIHYPL